MEIIRKSFIALSMLVMTCAAAAMPKVYDISSPDGTLSAQVNVDQGKITWSVTKEGNLVLSPSEIAMQLADGTAYDGAVKLQKIIRSAVDNVLDTPFYKKSQVKEAYNQLQLRFKTFDLEFRAYDAGVAYRFVSKSKVPFKVAGETARFAFPEDWMMYVPYVCQHTETLESQFYSSCENRYEHTPLSQWNKERIAFLPIMAETP